MDVPLVIRLRLVDLGVKQREMAMAAQVRGVLFCMPHRWVKQKSQV